MVPGFDPIVLELLRVCQSAPGAGSPPDAAARHRLEREVEGWGRLVRGDARAHARLVQLLVVDHELTRRDVRWCLGFLYSHLVNKYQGSLAEFLAAGAIGEWLGRQVAADVLERDAVFVPGDSIREQRLGVGGRRWDRGADWLLVASSDDAGDLLLVGVVEIKSYPASDTRVAVQFDRHVERLRAGGVRIGEREWTPDRVRPFVRDRHGGWCAGDGAADWSRLLRVVAAPGTKDTSGGRAHRVLLPVSHAALASTAYEMTARFLEELGREAFQNGNPWPEMTVEQAAVNAVKQALYYIILEGRADTSASARVAKRLYNVYGFGYDVSAGHADMLWPDGEGGFVGDDEPRQRPSDRPPASGLTKDIVEGAWDHFMMGQLEKAEVWARAAIEADPDKAGLRRVPWLCAMIRFFWADFAAACEALPPPGARPAKDDGAWVNDVLTSAKAFARAGHSAQARERLAGLERAGSRWTHLPFAIAAVRGWLALAEGEHRQATEFAEFARQELSALRDAVAERERREVGNPPFFDVGAIQAAVVDLAGLVCSLGSPRESMDLLDPLAGLFLPVVVQVTRDPAFEAARQAEGKRMQAWLARQEQGT